MSPTGDVEPVMTRARTLVLMLTVVGSGGALAGCFETLIGGMAESYRRTGTRSVPPEYTGLAGKSFAVVVAVDRVTQADFPEMVQKVTIDTSERLAKHAGGSGYIPGVKVLEYQYRHPRWVTMTMGQLREALGVERLVYVDLEEYRLNDIGNSYLWDGVASATVGIVEAESPAPDEFVFEKAVTVKFPDVMGQGPNELPYAAVQTELVRRLVDRVTWLFYEHEEKYYPDY